jgi:hypothetical protein
MIIAAQLFLATRAIEQGLSPTFCTEFRIVYRLTGREFIDEVAVETD